MNLGSQKSSPSPLYLIESDSSVDQNFIDQLGTKIELPIVQFSSLKAVLGTDIPSIILADMKTIGDADAIDTLTARFMAPVIILSGRHSMASAVTAMRAGACDFFPKPASVDAISERINGLLAQQTIVTNQTAAMHNRSNAIMPFWEQERDIIETALDVCKGNISRAAAVLQISPSTIYRKKQSWEELSAAKSAQ